MFYHSCIYTLRDEQTLDKEFRTGTGDFFKERRPWKSGLAYLEQARKEGAVLPVFFADAVETKDVRYWAVIERIEIEKGETKVRFRDLRRFDTPMKRELFLVHSKNRRIQPDDQRPYRLCRMPSPEELPKDTASSAACEESPKEAGLPSAAEFESYQRYVDEGSVRIVSYAVRRRCEALRNAAKRELKDSDGFLCCAACTWHRPAEGVKADVVELHHLDLLSHAPSGGRRLTYEEAIQRLVPLCPTCHRLAHSKPGGGTFSLPELQTFAASSSIAFANPRSFSSSDS